MQRLWTRDFNLAFAANFFMSFAFYLLMPTLPIHLLQTLRATPSFTGWVMASYVIAGLVVRPFSGFLIDRFPRKVFYVVLFGLYTLCGLLYFIAQTPSSTLGVRLLHGVVWALLLPAGSTIAIDICPATRRGEGIGFYGMSMNLAMALGPMMGIFLHDRMAFSVVLLATAGMAGLGFMVSLFIREPYHAPQPHAVLSLDRFLLKKGISGGIAMWLITISYGLLLAYASLYGKQQGIEGTGFFFVLVSVGFILSRLLCSRLLDQGWTVRLSIIGAFLSACALAGVAGFPLPWVYFLVATVLGVAYGMAFSAIQTWIIHRAEPHQRGTANSTYFTAFDLGVGTGLLLGGALGNQLSNALLISAGCALLGMGVLLGIKE